MPWSVAHPQARSAVRVLRFGFTDSGMGAPLDPGTYRQQWRVDCADATSLAKAAHPAPKYRNRNGSAPQPVRASEKRSLGREKGPG